ncbi:MAG TPA: YggT family protein [bacterium]|nr:YggT family protein [bacterium]
MVLLIEAIRLLANAVSLLIIARAVLSWVSPFPSNAVTRLVFNLTEPLLAPVRAILPNLGGLDFSPWVVLIAVQLLERLLLQTLFQMLG